MTRDEVDGRRTLAALRRYAAEDEPLRHHPPQKYQRFDLLLQPEDVQLLAALCAAVEQGGARRIPRATAGRVLLSRAIRLAAAGLVGSAG